MELYVEIFIPMIIVLQGIANTEEGEFLSNQVYIWQIIITDYVFDVHRFA